MKKVFVPDVGKSRRTELLLILKRRGAGMCVKELADELGLSYMGAKQICLALERAGYLIACRAPSRMGRPRLHYRLTAKAAELFPAPDLEPLLVILDAAAKFFGPTAPGKLLFSYFQEKTAQGSRAVSGKGLSERMESLARWRDAHGHFASVLPGNPPTLVERNQPLHKLFAAYPEALRMEEQMLSHVLGTPLRRETPLLSAGMEQHFIPIL